MCDLMRDKKGDIQTNADGSAKIKPCGKPTCFVGLRLSKKLKTELDRHLEETGVSFQFYGQKALTNQLLADSTKESKK